MTKKEIKTAQDSALITDAIFTYAHCCLNMNYNRPTKALDKHFDALCEEMLRRGLLSQDQIDRLHM